MLSTRVGVVGLFAFTIACAYLKTGPNDAIFIGPSPWLPIETLADASVLHMFTPGNEEGRRNQTRDACIAYMLATVDEPGSSAVSFDTRLPLPTLDTPQSVLSVWPWRISIDDERGHQIAHLTLTVPSACLGPRHLAVRTRFRQTIARPVLFSLILMALELTPCQITEHASGTVSFTVPHSAYAHKDDQ
jgi:hypothetical protein